MAKRSNWASEDWKCVIFEQHQLILLPEVVHNPSFIKHVFKATHLQFLVWDHISECPCAKVSSDPTEFFIDALGSLHIGSCSDVIVSHTLKIKLPWSKTEVEKAYEKFRYSSSQDDGKIHDEVLYFKSRFKCMTRNWNQLSHCSWHHLRSVSVWVGKDLSTGGSVHGNCMLFCQIQWAIHPPERALCWQCLRWGISLLLYFLAGLVKWHWLLWQSKCQDYGCYSRFVWTRAWWLGVVPTLCQRVVS